MKTREQMIREVAEIIDDATSAVLTDHVIKQAATEVVEAILGLTEEHCVCVGDHDNRGVCFGTCTKQDCECGDV